MPCRSYEDEDNHEVEKLRRQVDKLARIACKAMGALEKEGKEDFLLLKDDEVRIWWKNHKIADAKAAAEKAERVRVAKIKKEAMSKLSDEERKVLGIK